MAIMKGEGMRGLFRGVASPTLTVGLMSAVLFQSFESSKRLLSDAKRSYYGVSDNPQCTLCDLAISGAIAGTVSCLITSPTELFKIMVQQNTSIESATMRQEWLEGARLLKQYGFMRGVYRGLNMTIYRDAPAFAIYFPLYEVIINQYDPYRATQLVPFVGGGLAGMVSWAAVYPMDHIKTLYQLRQYKYGEWPLFKAIMYHLQREGGVRSIYKGLGATLLRCTPQHAVVFVCYEEVKKFLNQEIPVDQDLLEIKIPTYKSSSSSSSSSPSSSETVGSSPSSKSMDFASV
eukprot:CAMPEP_0202691276 /NCGR_PEP_ID=MMETSP1385-20130828/6036_1 /ASSEMBLY_ACC=CAM_ASM_000861 /TAXON_ID=933848 /ORGANISM="Elphidium margaritaceum" /LENGTH=289 /DNA_ID=CAMNT_0049346653 /DNA_START=259 /DNA_END=1128 /DNA_ORIENTATION=+